MTIRGWAFGLLLHAALASGLAAQTDILTGRVTGPDGQPLAGAQVTALSVELGTTRSAVSDARGRYTIVFPDGGGRYEVRVTYIGMAPKVAAVFREADEEVLITDFPMTVQAVQLDALEVNARPRAPAQANAGERAQELPTELLNRLPLTDFDPTTLALLTAGVIQTVGDSLNGMLGGFSVAGMRDALNQITLDGMSITSMLTGGTGLELPLEGLRQTQVVTSTFDASRGGFAGGQVSMTTARGTNRRTGQFTYVLRDPALQSGLANTSFGNTAATQHQFSGGFGGALLRNRLFFHISGRFTHQTTDRFALQPDDPLAYERLNASPDSVNRFLNILSGTYGFPTQGLTGAYANRSNTLIPTVRLDYNISQGQTLAATFTANVVRRDSTGISPFELRDNGGDQDNDNRRASLQLISRFGGSWTNDFTIVHQNSESKSLPYFQMPEGRVRVASESPDGTRSFATLAFGGDRAMPRESWDRSLQIRNEVGFLYDVSHRIKLGAQVDRRQFASVSTNNYYGSFTFESLEDFETNRPSSFSRSLTPRERRGGGTNFSAWLTDTWRPTNPLQITMGLRVDYTSFDERPAYNPAVDHAFNRRTDKFPLDVHVSPRFGFSWRLNQPGELTRVIRGGIGEFRGQAPSNLFANALQQTGLPGSELTLNCIGDAVPIPDWNAYLTDFSKIPVTCADGGTGAAPSQSLRAPSVTVFHPEFASPSSWRLNLGWQQQLTRTLQLNADYTYSIGVNLYGVRDLNLNESQVVTLDNEGGRPFFGDPSAIVPETGQVSSRGSRVDTAFANVFEYSSNLRSRAHQLTVRLQGSIPSPRLMFSGGYTLGFTRDQSSFSGGGGGAGLSSATTAGNPNIPEWGTSSNDRRHSFNLMLGYPVLPWLQLTVQGTLSSGAPITPMVERDINGDGSRNDRAFVFDPANAADTAIANGMQRLLATAPDRVRDCLRAQLGRVADRNSCRNEWTENLNMAVIFAPMLPRFGRRVEIQANLSNVPAALDQLLHGKQDVRGWGQNPRVENSLLYVRGFDPATRSFRYEVNEQFGQKTQRFTQYRPFELTLQARILLNPQRGGGAGAFGAIAGGGGRGGGGGGRGFGPGGFGGGAPGAGAQGGQPFNPENMVARALSNPVANIMLRRDSLGLTEAQLAQLQVVADSLDARLAPTMDSLRTVLQAHATADSAARAGADSAAAAGAGAGARADSARTGGAGQTGNAANDGRGQRAQGGGAGPGPGGRGQRGNFAIAQTMRQLQPMLERGRRMITDAMSEARRILTEEQWNKLPPSVRNFGQGGRRGGGGGL